MNLITTCPCCSSKMLHHLSNHRDYWFCRKCWSEMPDLEAVEQKHHLAQNQSLTTRQHRGINLSINLNKAIPV